MPRSVGEHVDAREEHRGGTIGFTVDSRTLLVVALMNMPKIML